ncbi:MAG: hypothetical protein HY521_11715 [Proteobacteria bacterium]|nr:hypothetical protein [Pseudomonadota bacterium]
MATPKTAARMLVLAALAAALAACETVPPPRTLPELSFAHLPPIRLAVARLEIDDRYQPPFKEPNVEHRLATPPARAAASWARDRLRADGADGVARFVISRAAVVETHLPTRGGIVGVFTRDQGERYDADLEVMLEILSERGTRLGFINAHASRSRTVEEGISLAERERVWFEMTAALVQDLDGELGRQIRTHLGDFVVTR